MNETLCKFPGCKRHPQKNGYCIGHSIYGPTASANNRSGYKVIKPKSEKRTESDKEYSKIVAELLKKSPMCKVKSPVCTKKAQGAHHKQKRSPKNINDKKNLIECCNMCNNYIEEHPDWATENGFSISRFAK